MGTSAFYAANICLLLSVASAHVVCGPHGCSGGAVACPAGYIASGSSCVISHGIGVGGCTGGTGTACANCPGGTCSGCTGGACATSTVCPQGYYAFQNRCEQYSCPPNHIFSGGHCQMMGHGCSQVCQQGYVLVGNMCHMQSIQPCAPQSCTSASSCQHTCYSGQQCCNSQVIVQPQVVCPTVQPATTASPTPTHPTVTITPQLCTNTTIIRERECANVTCPGSTKWDGQKCMTVNTLSHNSSVDIKHFINNVNTINSPTNVNIKNDNNVYVYTADERRIDISSKGGGGDKTVTNRPIETTHAPVTIAPTPKQPCCIVVTPRICSQINTKWVCYNRKYSRCGSFCKYPKIHLKPIRPMHKQQFMVVPPQIPCTGHNCGGPGGCSGCATGGHCGSHCEEHGSVDYRDCSGCASGGHCSSYCQDYSCGSSCQFYEQQDYCQENHGQPGCFEYDGCYEDWCSK